MMHPAGTKSYVKLMPKAAADYQKSIEPPMTPVFERKKPPGGGSNPFAGIRRK